LKHYHSAPLHGTVSFEYANFGYKKPKNVVKRIIDPSQKRRDNYAYFDND